MNYNVLSNITPQYICGGGCSGGGGSGGGGSSTDSYIMDRYIELATIVIDINDYLQNYSVGNIDYVIKNLTKSVFYELSIKLMKLKQDNIAYREFETIRSSVEKTLQGLFRSIYVYLDLESTKRELLAMTERESILHDVTKLKEYIASLSGSVNLFPDIEVTTISATLKPEIAEYIKLFGLPQNGVFETDKMAIALQNISYNVC